MASQRGGEDNVWIGCCDAGWLLAATANDVVTGASSSRSETRAEQACGVEQRPTCNQRCFQGVFRPAAAPMLHRKPRATTLEMVGGGEGPAS